MNKKHLLTVAIFALLLPGAGVAHADTAKFDAAMKLLLAPYYKIHAALAGDTEKGVKEAAKELAKLAGEAKPAVKKVTGKNAKHYKGLPSLIQQEAEKMATKAGIEARRAAFRELSMLMVIWAGLSKVGGLNMVYCYCSGGGSWLQVDKQLANPYFGKKMLRCGKIISG